MSLATTIALILVNYTTCNCNSLTQCLRILTTTTFYQFRFHISKKWFQDFKKKKSSFVAIYMSIAHLILSPKKTKPNEGVVEEYDLQYTISSKLISESAKMYLNTGRLGGG